MDISTRSNMLISLANEAAQGATNSLSKEEKDARLRDLRDNLSNTGGQMSYSDDQKALLASYQDLFDNWESYGAYVYQPLQDLGDWVVKKTIGPLISGTSDLKESAKEHDLEGADGNLKDKHDEAAKELRKASSEYLHNREISIDNIEQEFLKFNKIASSKASLGYLSNRLGAAFEENLDYIHENLLSECGDVDTDFFNQNRDLALACIVLEDEGYLKEAQAIDRFVLEHNVLIKNAFLGDAWEGTKNLASSAWEGTKKIVSKGLKYAGKAADTVWRGIKSGAKWIAEIALKGIKYLAKWIPAIGILFSLPMFIKNIIEAYQNAKRIFWEDPHNMGQFGFKKWDCISPTGLPAIISTFRSAVKEHKRSPDNLKKILEIFRTVGAFWMDSLLAITNGLMAILDTIVIAGLFFPGVGWLVSAGAMGGSWLIDIGLMSIELSGEYFKDSYWEKEEKHLLQTAQQEVQAILGEGSVETEDDGDMFELIPMDISSSTPNPDVIETAEAPIAAAA